MIDADRQARNTLKLAECHPVIRAQLQALIAALEGDGFRPRIQQAWRSTVEQAAFKAAGTSKLGWGLHNCTAPDGTPESLAVDLLDDDAPLAPSVRYLVRLASLARANGLQTGIGWGLPTGLRAAVEAAMSAPEPPVRLKMGWDPTHVETRSITVREARAGVRPQDTRRFA